MLMEDSWKLWAAQSLRLQPDVPDRHGVRAHLGSALHADAAASPAVRVQISEDVGIWHLGVHRRFGSSFWLEYLG